MKIKIYRKTNNSKLYSFLESFSYAFSSNLLSLLISIVTVLIVPKLVGISEYGYWQLYMLYISYTGIIQLGWCDGIYLRYGGKEYNKLNKGIISSQFLYVTIFYVIFSLLICLILNLFWGDKIYLRILIYTVISGLITTPRGLLYNILQATNNIKQYAKILMIDRGAYFIILVSLLSYGIRNYQVLILSDLIGKLISLVVVVYLCRDIVFAKIAPFRESILEADKNINAGFKLMVAGIASLLIIGIVRLSIERNWGIEVFGKISLTMSVSNLLMVFINAVGIVMFPMLRRTLDNKLPGLYSVLRTLLMLPLLFMFVFYYPAKVILSAWLPQYADSLIYMALLFPLCVYESKMTMLVNTYLKALRKEKQILIVNLATVVLSILTTIMAVSILNNLILAITSIVFLLAFRCIFAEIIISKILKINVIRDIILELGLSIIFISSSWFIGGWKSVGVYFIAYFVYLMLNRKVILQTALSVKLFITKS